MDLKSSYFNFRVMVKMKNLLTENSWLWERGKFMNRRYLMQVGNNILNISDANCGNYFCDEQNPI